MAELRARAEAKLKALPPGRLAEYRALAAEQVCVRAHHHKRLRWLTARAHVLTARGSQLGCVRLCARQASLTETITARQVCVCVCVCMCV